MFWGDMKKFHLHKDLVTIHVTEKGDDEFHELGAV